MVSRLGHGAPFEITNSTRTFAILLVISKLGGKIVLLPTLLHFPSGLPVFSVKKPKFDIVG